MDSDIEIRFGEFIGRLNSMHRSAMEITKKICQEAARENGFPILTPPQVKTLAYVLGFDDSQYEYPMDGPFGISSPTYKTSIEAHIPSEERVAIHLKRKSKCNTKAYTLKGVAYAFKKLDKRGCLKYSPQRMRDAIAFVAPYLEIAAEPFR